MAPGSVSSQCTTPLPASFDLSQFLALVLPAGDGGFAEPTHSLTSQATLCDTALWHSGGGNTISLSPEQAQRWVPPPSRQGSAEKVRAWQGIQGLRRTSDETAAHECDKRPRLSSGTAPQVSVTFTVLPMPTAKLSPAVRQAHMHLQSSHRSVHGTHVSASLWVNTA